MNRRLKVLSSDDDEGIRSLLFSLLTEHGHEVEFARDSDEVFRNLGRIRYDLLILDVNTPGMNGYKVAEKISTNITNRPKILIFTGRNIEEEKFQFVSSGADAIVRKGSACNNILDAINGLFTGGDAAGDGMPAKMQKEAVVRQDPRTESLTTARRKMNEDIQYCLKKMTQVEDEMTTKNLRYEEFIRELLKEKQRTEKNYLEFKRIEGEVLKLKNWGYAFGAAILLVLARSFF